MEDRSSRRMRTLVTRMARRGLSVNEVARALISMMARSKCSNQRPDTLMRDRSPPARRNHLQRTAGPYIWVKTGKAQCEDMFSALPENGHCSLQLNRIIPLGNAPFRVVGVQNWVQSDPPRLSSAGCPSDAVRCSK